MKKIICLFIFPFLFACEKAEVIAPETYACSLSQPDQTQNHPQKNELQVLLEEVGLNTPGMQMAVRTPDQQLWTSGFGKADIPNNIPFEACHKTMIGSISKVFTGVLIMQLQDEGILDVDDLLKDWLDESVIGEIENADVVSLRQLLNHTSGIRDYLGIRQYIDALNTPYYQQTQTEKLQYIYGKKAELAPGTRYSYSNSNYVLLGLVVEQARKMTLWDAVRTYITEPLQLQNCEMGTHEQPIPSGTVRPYRLVRKGKYEEVMHLAVSDAATGDGGIASNMHDINLFIEALFAGKLLSQEAFEEMTQELTPTGEDEADFDWPDETYGLGISRWNTPYGTAFGHTGGTTTYSTFLFYFPDQNVSVSVGFNSDADAEGWEQRFDLRDKVFELIF